MAIQYRCGSCNETIQTPDDAAGKMGRCPHCSSITQIPGGKSVGSTTKPDVQYKPASAAPSWEPHADHAPQPAPWTHQPAQSWQAPYHQPGFPAGPYYAGPLMSDRSKTLAGILGILVGGFGVHRFYLGFVGIGVAQILVTLITCGVGAWWGVIEGILILTGSIDRDVDGLVLRE